jgi:hypothetical protein
MSLLGIEYDNLGFGRNVLDNPTSSVVYSTDGMLCARDSSYLCLIDPRSNFRKIYNIRENYKELASGDSCLILDTLLRRRFAAYEYLVSHKKTTLVK